jgi:hypothetical protein
MADRFVGIDVSKNRFVVIIRPTGESISVQNADESFTGLVERLQREIPTLVGLKRTVEQCPCWRTRDQLLRSVPGVGFIVSTSLLA